MVLYPFSLCTMDSRQVEDAGAMEVAEAAVAVADATKSAEQPSIAASATTSTAVAAAADAPSPPARRGCCGPRGGSGGGGDTAAKARAKPKAPTVKVRELFRYATPCDIFYYAVALIAAAANGFIFPGFTLLL